MFATKMAKIHLQQQQQLLQEETLPRASRGPNGGGRLGPTGPPGSWWGQQAGPRDGAAKPSRCLNRGPWDDHHRGALGSLRDPPQEQKAKLYVRGSREASQPRLWVQGAW